MSAADTGFDCDRLLDRLNRLPAAGRYVIGFSGGIDSTALLTALHELGIRRPAPLQALHFHHGLHPDADTWQRHCERFCSARDIPFRVEHLQIDVPDGSSPETAARDARYEAVRRLLQPGEVFLTGHHADDRAETLFLNLVRGSGIDGLAAIPATRKLGNGRVARPLLDFRRSELEDFLARRSIPWIEDPSNRDTGLDRNFLRHEVFPRLEHRWPGVVGRLAAAAAQARQAVDVLAEELDTRHHNLLADPWTLPAPPLKELPRVMQALLIRHWIRDRGARPPPATRLNELLDQLQNSKAASRVEMRWAGWQIKRHGAKLWLHRHPFAARCPEHEWSGGECLELGGSFGRLTLEGARAAACQFVAGPRRPGVAMQLHPGGPHRPLKDLLRESGLPPWLRTAVPVLYRRDEVLAVGDWLLSVAWRDWLAKRQASYRWEPEDSLLKRLRAEAHAVIIDRPPELRYGRGR